MNNHDWDSSREIAAVMHDFRLGKEYAFEVVFKSLYRYLFYYCDNIIENDQESEDICLISFQGLFRNCEKFYSEETIRAYLFKSAHNRCMTFIETKKSHSIKQSKIGVSVEDTGLIDKYYIDNPLKEKIEHIVEMLPDDCKRVFKMIIFDEMEPKEIAVALNISVSTVYNQKFRAINYLKKALQLKTKL